MITIFKIQIKFYLHKLNWSNCISKSNVIAETIERNWRNDLKQLQKRIKVSALLGMDYWDLKNINF